MALLVLGMGAGLHLNYLYARLTFREITGTRRPVEGRNKTEAFPQVRHQATDGSSGSSPQLDLAALGRESSRMAA